MSNEESRKKFSRTTTIEEYEMLKRHTDRQGFADDYVATFRGSTNGLSQMRRASYLWGVRDNKLKQYEIALAKVHTVTAPVVLKTKSPATQHRSDSFPDIGEMLVKCHNVLVEIAAVQKEQLELFRQLGAKTPK